MSFFTFYDMPDFRNNWGEIDIEILGRYDNEVQFNAIVGHHEMHEHRETLSFNPHDDFHVYGFDWTPEYIAWSVDGKEVYRQEGEHVRRMNAPQKIMMNVWISEFLDWTGPFDEAALPVQAEYDFVRYSEYDPANKSFTGKWTDDFKRLDLGRWSLATHTFEGNKVDFTPDNARVKDGVLILKIDKKYLPERTDPNAEEKSTEGSGEILKAEVVSDNMIRITFKGDTYAPYARKKNFSIEGLEVLKTKLHSDLRTIDIYVSGLNSGMEYILGYTVPGMSEQRVKINR